MSRVRKPEMDQSQKQKLKKMSENHNVYA